MFFFDNNSSAEYEKVFFDHKIKSISGTEIDLKDFNNKVILLVNKLWFILHYIIIAIPIIIK